MKSGSAPLKYIATCVSFKFNTKASFCTHPKGVLNFPVYWIMAGFCSNPENIFHKFPCSRRERNFLSRTILDKCWAEHTEKPQASFHLLRMQSCMSKINRSLSHRRASSNVPYWLYKSLEPVLWLSMYKKVINGPQIFFSKSLRWFKETGPIPCAGCRYIITSKILTAIFEYTQTCIV